MIRIPIISAAIKSRQFASHAFADEQKKYRNKQQWKSFFLALANPGLAAEWFHTLQSPRLFPVFEYRKRLYLKPFRPYMSMNWTKRQKIKVILDTYRFLYSKSDQFTGPVIYGSGLEIARVKLSDTIEAVLVLGYDEGLRKEGELVLSFKCEALGGKIASASFSFEETGAGRFVSRIACVQGNAGAAENASKTAQKLMYGLRPKSLLIYAIQELSRQLEMEAVYGAGTSIQVYRGKHLIHLPGRHAIQFDYNGVWCEAGGIPATEGWFELPLVPVRKTAEETKSHKRAWYQKRYQMLDDISAKIGETLHNVIFVQERSA